ncbi:MAG: filamentous hemagglutinin N-terminal domain-containing protein, partial [Burkholderiales bacterium]|nr:filamentous hemagglutinin N-terminal domain-containing protein [Burkholderiales bacterium]
MNRVYRIVWSKTRAAYVVAAENARAQGKGTSHAWKAIVAALTAAGLAHAQLPSGGQIVLGSGHIAQDGAVMTITQTSERLAAHWQSFSIGAGNTVRFVQPSAQAVALNRVLSHEPSVIQGALQANGQVYLINPNGVLFTPSAQVDVGGLIASTLDLRDDDFLSGRLRFNGASNAAVVNHGDLRAAPGGMVGLIAARVENHGAIDAPRGQVLLGAGRDVHIDLGGPVKLRVEEGVLEALIEQGGAIRADGGAVWLTARGAGELAGAMVNHRGLIRANALSLNERGEVVLTAEGSSGLVDIDGAVEANAGVISVRGPAINLEGSAQARSGRIELDAERTLYLDGLLDVSASPGQAGKITARARRIEGTGGARLDASGEQGGHIHLQGEDLAWLSSTLDARGQAQGGRIEVTGETVALMRARLDASGADQGGVIHVGGAWQGGGELPQARVTYVGPGSTLAADGQRGGEVVLWSRERTDHLGEASARGGGRIEASSAGELRLQGELDAGAGGTVLLDPKNLVITDTPPDTLTFVKRLTSGSGALGMPSLATDDYFGSSVALKGDLLAVGAPQDDTGGSNRGAVYLFTGANTTNFSGLTFAKKLAHATGATDMPSLNNNARFGQAVAIHGDRLAVGADGDNTGGTARGAVFLFTGVGTDYSNLKYEKKIASGIGATGMPALNNNDRFGIGLALDGDLLAVGAYLDDTGGTDRGAVYLFTGVGVNFSGLQYHARYRHGDTLPGGGSLDLNNDIAYFGRDVALDKSGGRLVVTAPRDGTGGSDRGAVYLFSFTPNTAYDNLKLEKKLASGTGAFGMPGLADNDRFGGGVALRGDWLAVGAHHSNGYRGAVYLFSGASSPSYGGLAHVLTLTDTGSGGVGASGTWNLT